MIANINPSHAVFDESHNTLKYANRAKNIKVRPKAHVVTSDLSYQQRIARLEHENTQLRKALLDAQIELDQDEPIKRKSNDLAHLSPATIKRFKNMSWEDGNPLNQSRASGKDQVTALVELNRHSVRISSRMSATSHGNSEVSMVIPRETELLCVRCVSLLAID